MLSRRRWCEDRVLFLAVIATLALYYILPWVAVSWLVLLVLAALTWRRLDLVLAALPLTFPFWYVPKHITVHAVLPLSEIVLAVCVAVALLQLTMRAVTHRRPVDLGHDVRGLWDAAGWPIWLAAAALLVAGVLGVLVARRPAEALREFRWEVVEPIVYLVLLLALRHVPSLLRRTVGAFLASAAILAVLAAVQMLAWHVTFAPLAAGNAVVPLVPDSDGVLRATGLIYGSGNSLGAYLERALPLAAVFAILPPALTGLSGRQRVTCAGLGLAYVVALVWSQSRGAWAGALVALAVVAVAVVWRTSAGQRIASMRGARLSGVAAGILGVVLVVVALCGRALLTVALAGHNGSGEMRALLWLAAWHMIRDHPLLGIGPDQFLYYYSNLYTTHPYWITSLNGHPTIAWREPNLAHPHNLVLDLWLSVGILGLMAVIALLVRFFRHCVHLWLDARALAERHRPGLSTLGLGAAAAMLAGLVHGMADSAYFEPDLAMVFWWLLAVVLLARARARAAPNIQPAALPAEGAKTAGE
ncbi:MAG: O-antigen ligase family protein [Ktedonobacterales bacterium]